MKAIRVHQFGGPEVLKLENVPDLQPGKGQVLIRVHAIGVNPVDTYIRSGSNPSLPLPYTPGIDASGVVVSTGEGVTQFQADDRVYTSSSITGTYAELTLCEVADVHPKPDKINFPQAAALGVPYATAYRALFQRGKAIPGEAVLIHGASGGVGMAAVQLARATGLTIIGTAGTNDGRKLVAEQGAHYVLDHREPNYLENALQLTSGRGVDLILEMLANVNLAQDLPILARNGRVIVVGSRGKIEITPRDLMGRDADIRGMILFNASREELVSIHTALGAGLENGSLRPVVGKQFTLAEAPQAHITIMQPGAYGKIILVP